MRIATNHPAEVSGLVVGSLKGSRFRRPCSEESVVRREMRSSGPTALSSSNEFPIVEPGRTEKSMVLARDQLPAVFQRDPDAATCRTPMVEDLGFYISSIPTGLFGPEDPVPHSKIRDRARSAIREKDRSVRGETITACIEDTPDTDSARSGIRDRENRSRTGRSSPSLRRLVVPASVERRSTRRAPSARDWEDSRSKAPSQAYRTRYRNHLGTQ